MIFIINPQLQAMPSEIIAIHFGQCGNQIGDAFWRSLCAEHGIGPDGTLKHNDIDADDLKRVFFYQVYILSCIII